MGTTTQERYTVISADCHAGADLHQYRGYLEQRYHAAFDEWARTYAIPYADLLGEDGSRNWDSDRRLAEMDSDGIAAEVIFPNTIPPFYPEPSLKTQAPGASDGDLALRWAGLQAHNRWLVDFCAATPGRRAGIAQIMLHDIDAAVAEIHWAASAGLKGGILLPGTPPGSGLPPLYSPEYEPIWRACAETGLPINHHSGSAVPPLGDQPIDEVTFLLEVTWWAHRAFWHLVFGGVMDRYPDLQFVFTEQGTSWIPETLGTLDYFHHRMSTAEGSQEYEWGHPVVEKLALRPSEYWARQCHVGSSFMRPAEVGVRHAVGVERIMWGSDYPHRESSYPFSREALRLTFSGVDPSEATLMLGANAAELYGFDLAFLAPVAARIGPTHAEIAEPLSAAEIPADADRCPAFVGVAR
ncbi:MAG: amidohydrolase family protein [Actinomycetota bacterium]|jgi:predicted TIM-barrel fold metal-dependent hydrolase|nr:amidohydrolase family protein [Actinomycetota bacterium]